MPGFQLPFEPLALPGEAVKLLPDGDVYEVKAVEQMAEIGPVDYGTASSNSDATEGGSNIIDLEDELEMNKNDLGQFTINPLSRVEVEIRQTGDQDQRFVNSNKVGTIRPHTPLNQRVVYVYEGEAPKAIITNPQDWDMAKTLVYYSGYKLELGNRPVDGGGFAGQPAAVPVDTLKQTGGGRR